MAAIYPFLFNSERLLQIQVNNTRASHTMKFASFLILLSLFASLFLLDINDAAVIIVPFEGTSLLPTSKHSLDNARYIRDLFPLLVLMLLVLIMMKRTLLSGAKFQILLN